MFFRNALILLCATFFMTVFVPSLAFAEEEKDVVLEEDEAFDADFIGENRVHSALYEDTLVQLARDYNLGFNELRAANPGLDPWMPGEGTEIVLPTMHILPDAPREGIVINLPEQRFYFYQEKDKAPLTHPIGIGREGLATPMGATTVVRKAIGPVWRPTARMRKEDPSLPEKIGPGSNNPLGTHALYLGWPQYAMHGTNKPYGIGRRSSSGCIRLYPEDIVSMYDIVPVGTKVRVVDQPIKLAWVDDALYMEAHPSLAQAASIEQSGLADSYEVSPEILALIVQTAGEYAEQIDWVQVRRLIRERRGFSYVIARKNDVEEEAEGAQAEEITEQAGNDLEEKAEDFEESDSEKEPENAGEEDAETELSEEKKVAPRVLRGNAGND